MCFIMVEKDPFGVCNYRYTSAAFGKLKDNKLAVASFRVVCLKTLLNRPLEVLATDLHFT